MGYQRDLVASRLAPLESAGRQEGGVRGGGHPWRRPFAASSSTGVGAHTGAPRWARE